MKERDTGTKPSAMDKILSDKNKGQDSTEASPGGVLARLWRQILFDLRISSLKWHSLIGDYINSLRKKELGNPSTQSLDENENRSPTNISLRGTLNKEMAGPSLTYKTFLKGLSILGAIKIKMSIEITWANKNKTTHSLNVNLVTDEEADERYRNYEQRYMKKGD